MNKTKEITMAEAVDFTPDVGSETGIELEENYNQRTNANCENCDE